MKDEVSSAADDSRRRNEAETPGRSDTSASSPRRLRWLKRIAIAALAFVLVGWIALEILLRQWTAKPPPLPPDTAILQQQPQTNASGRVTLGQSWTERRDGLMVVRLKGQPFDMGYTSGRLLREQTHTLEREFLEMIRSYVPQDWKIKLLQNYITYRNRRLSDFIPLDYRLQIYGSTLGTPDIHPQFGDYYNRVLNYHAAQDVSYMMIDNPLVSRAGCTAFAAWGKASAGGHLVTGRNFDWEAAEVFSRDRVVILCEPDGGIPFISLAWAGMAGVVSGMNRAGVSVTINGAPCALPDDTASPVAIVARDVLQKTRNLSEALDIIRQSKVFVSTIWLIGSRADGKFIVVEKTPEGTAVRESDSDAIIASNHFQTDAMKSLERNTNFLVESTSVSRYQRIDELLRSARGAVDAKVIAGFLRDRKLPGGVSAGETHRGTLNACIATHSVVMDLTDGIFWAATPPNQLGKFVAFDVNDFERRLPDLALPSDASLASGQHEKVAKARQRLKDGKAALERGDAEGALKAADEAEALNPGFYQNAALRGRALVALKRTTEAKAAFTAALAGQPAFLAERRELEEELRRLQ
jgi:isopenicillin-N N-acyltransferase-like protein